MKKAPILQPALFNLDSPPVKLVTPAPPMPALEEAAFYEALFERSAPGSPKVCPWCGGSYLCLSWHLLRACSAPGASPQSPQTIPPSAPAGGLVLEGAPVSSPLPQAETPEREPSENMPGAYAYKSKGVPEGDKMHPSYRPPTRVEAPQEEREEEPEKPPRPPHWWHWVRPSTTGSKAQEPYTPTPAARRRSIPSIACSLYSAAWSCYQTKDDADNAAPGYVKVSSLCYEIDKRKVEKLITLLVFCGVEEKLARGLCREAWQDAREEKWRAWSDNPKSGKKGIGRGLLRLIGYELADGEDDGYFDTAGASFGDFANKEGMSGR